MGTWDNNLDTYDPVVAERRAKSIPGSVETDEQKADRERQQIKKARKTLADETRDARWALEDARRNFRLMRLGLVVSLVAGSGIVTGWIIAVVWWMALSAFSGGVGLRLALFLFALVVCTGIVGSFIWSAIEKTHQRYDGYKTVQRRVTNAVEASSDYELELLERSFAPSLAEKGTSLVRET